MALEVDIEADLGRIPPALDALCRALWEEAILVACPGEMPLPPIVLEGARLNDPNRYQTVLC